MKGAVRQFLSAAGYELNSTRYRLGVLSENERRATFQDLACRLMFERGEALSFIQVGAFDGITRDPLRPFIERCNWSGVLIEPQPGPASKLRLLYAGNPRISILQGALSEKDGEQTLYTLEGGEDAGLLASFDRSVIEKHGLGKPLATTVPCFPFSRPLSVIPSPDLLQIDAEGADAYILSLFPFDRIKPAIVQFEVKHLSWPDRRTCLERLAAFGYRFASGDEDIVASLL